MFGLSSNAEKPAPMTGAEVMLKSMGLGEVILAARALANAGTVQKIVDFADGVERLTSKVEVIISRLDAIEGRLASIEEVFAPDDPADNAGRWEADIREERELVTKGHETALCYAEPDPSPPYAIIGGTILDDPGYSLTEHRADL